VSKLGKALPPVVMAAAVVAAFGVMMFLTVWYSPDCRSPHKSVALGGAALVAGCADRSHSHIGGGQ
jgi:hypothetical protein